MIPAPRSFQSSSPCPRCARYLGYVREIAQTWLDWTKLAPRVQQYQALISNDVAADTHKLYSNEAFAVNVTEDVTCRGFGEGALGLKNFADQRRAYLLDQIPRVQNPSR